MNGIVDLHTHFFGPEFFRFLAAAAHPEGDPSPGLARLEAAGIRPATGTATEHADRWLEEMDAHGVETMVTFASLPVEVDSVAEGVRASGGRLVQFALTDPTQADAPDRIARWVAEQDVRGLLLFPAMHCFDLSAPAMDAVYREADRSGLAILVHMGTLRVRVRDILGLPSNFDITYASPTRLAGAVERFPNVRFIIPHFGGGYLNETLELGRAHGNVSVDTSSSNSWIRLQPGSLTLAQVFERTLEALGPERVHFGTDSSVFPRGWRDDVHQEQVEALASIGADDATRNLVLRGNTLRLLGRDGGAG